MNQTSATGEPESMIDELAALTTEQIDLSLRALDTLPTPDLVAAMNKGDQAVPDAVAEALPAIATAVDGVTARLKAGGRLIYIGAGTPGRLGVLDASECPPTFGTDPNLVVGIIAGGVEALRNSIEGAEDDAAAGAADLTAIKINSTDVVVGISASGRTPYVIGALEYAKEQGALTVAVACNHESRIGAIADLPIEVIVGAEFIAGSTRLKAGTAQKLVLNMISTLTMVRLGKTYGNVMVDLQATNAKLQARSARIIMAVTEVDSDRAYQELDAADGSVKIAILSILTGQSASISRERLQQHDGYLRAALTP